jgi:pilus assembly protein CpaF
VELPLPALRQQIASGINFILQAGRLQDGTRKITHLSEVVGVDASSGRYLLRDIFARQYEGMDEHGQVISDLVFTGNLPKAHSIVRDHGLELPLSMLEAAELRGGGSFEESSEPQNPRAHA